ncbi:MAG: MraY family glycosyltransferase [bacterium]
MLYYILIFAGTVLLSAVLTWLALKLALKLGITDKPDQDRKTHGRETALLGGMAVFAAFFIVLYFARRGILGGNLEPRHWIGFFAGGIFLMIGGFLDDRYNLKPARQIIWPVLAIASVIAGGVEIEKITGPFGGYFYLGNFSAVLIAFWLLGMMYTTKLLDGLDGLVSGMTAIGSLVIFLFTMSAKYYQPDISLAALILAAACAGFLFFNWHPAKIFLGEGGSVFLGYALGVLSIISGGKFAVALLVMGMPALDAAWTIIRRIISGKNPFKFADREHLHFRLLNLGLGVKKSVLLFYAISIIFGMSALFLQSKGKIFALAALFAIMIFAISLLAYLDRKRKIV